MQPQPSCLIDQYALSRQLAAFGFQKQQKLMKMRVFIHGVTGLGIEIAKNLVLMRVKEIGIFDNNVVTMKDVARNFACRQYHVGNLTRAAACKTYIQGLRSECNVTVSQDDSIDKIVQDFDIVVIVDNYNTSYITQLNQQCRQKNIGFVLAGCMGLYGYTFVDFGPNHTISDSSGQQIGNRNLRVQNVTQSQHGIVLLNDSCEEVLVDGDIVEFHDVKGMTEVNDKRFKVNVVDKFLLEIGDTRGFSGYVKGGTIKKVAVPLEMRFKSFLQSLTTSQTHQAISSTIPLSSSPTHSLHIILNSLYRFYHQHHYLPQPEDLTQLLTIVEKTKQQFQSNNFIVEQVSEQFVRKFLRYGETQISPVCMFWGGIVAQQVLKFTGKYRPIGQWMHYEFVEMVGEIDVERKQVGEDTRYSDYAVLFGDDLVSKMQQLRLLMVGAGSVGNQCLKMLAMMGVGAGKDGQITIVDDNNVQKHALCSHSLLRQQNIGSNKAKCLTSPITQLNPSITLIAIPLKLQPQTQHIFDDDFFSQQDLILEITENNQSRKYIDRQCVWYQKPMIDVKTNGVKGNVVIVIPHKTQSIEDMPVENENTYNVEYGKMINFPVRAEDAVDWARRVKFQQLFEEISSDLRELYTSPNTFFLKHDQPTYNRHKTPLKKIKTLKILYEANQTKSYQACVQLMIYDFIETFFSKITYLLAAFEDSGQQQGGVWKKYNKPEAIELSVFQPLHQEFIHAGANIYAWMLGIAVQGRVGEVKRMVEAAMTKQQDNDRNNLTEEEEGKICKEVIQEFKTFKIDVSDTPKEIKLDLEDPTNWHIQFIDAASKLRAHNYKITPFTTFQTRIHAARIHPRLITTASITAGITGLQLIKYLLQKPSHNSSINLASTHITFCPPSQPILSKDQEFDPLMCGPVKAVPGQFTKWTKIEITRPMLLCEFKEFLEGEYGVKVTMICYGEKIVYAVYDLLKTKHRLLMPVQEAVSQVVKKKIYRIKKQLCISVCAEKEQVDVIMPEIRYHIAGKQTK